MNWNWNEVKRMLSGLAALLGVAGLCAAAPELGAQANFVNSSPYGIPAAANNIYAAMAVDVRGNLYAVNRATGGIDAFSAGSETYTTLPITGIDPNNSGLACDGMGNLYVAIDKVLSSGLPVGTVQKYTPGGGFTQVASGWYEPEAVAYRHCSPLDIEPKSLVRQHCRTPPELRINSDRPAVQVWKDHEPIRPPNCALQASSRKIRPTGWRTRR